MNHLYNTAFIAELIAEQLGCTPRQKKIIRSCALYHDIGKFGVDPSILSKNSYLTSKEFAEVKKHTLYGYIVLKKNFMHYEAMAALMHHERLDGSGYPLGLSGDAIPFFIRIISAADVFSALTEYRPYRPIISIKEAIHEALVELSDTRKYDKKVVAAITAIEKETTDCYVKLPVNTNTTKGARC